MKKRTGLGPDDYERVEINLYNLKGSGLRSICISDFLDDDADEVPPLSTSRSMPSLAASSSRPDIGQDERASPELANNMSRGKLMKPQDVYHADAKPFLVPSVKVKP